MSVEGTVAPWYPTGDDNKLAKWDIADYKCGSGVFMRGLFCASRQKATRVSELVASNFFQDFLCGSARAACGAPRDDLFDCLNVLATLTAALQLLQPDRLSACQT